MASKAAGPKAGALARVAPQYRQLTRTKGGRLRIANAVEAYRKGSSLSRAAEVGDVSLGLMDYALWRAGMKVSDAEPLATRQDLEAFWQSIDG